MFCSTPFCPVRGESFADPCEGHSLQRSRVPDTAVTYMHISGTNHLISSYSLSCLVFICLFAVLGICCKTSYTLGNYLPWAVSPVLGSSQVPSDFVFLSSSDGCYNQLVLRPFFLSDICCEYNWQQVKKRKKKRKKKKQNLKQQNTLSYKAVGSTQTGENTMWSHSLGLFTRTVLGLFSV